MVSFPRFESNSRIRRLEVGLIDPNPAQPRRSFSRQSLEELAGSIRANEFDYKLQEYKDNIPNLISRRQFNDRRKKTAGLCSVNIADRTALDEFHGIRR